MAETNDKSSPTTSGPDSESASVVEEIPKDEGKNKAYFLDFSLLSTF